MIETTVVGIYNIPCGDNTRPDCDYCNEYRESMIFDIKYCDSFIEDLQYWYDNKCLDSCYSYDTSTYREFIVEVVGGEIQRILSENKIFIKSPVQGQIILSY